MNDWVLEQSCERSAMIPSHFKRGQKGKKKKKNNRILKDKLFQKEFESSQCTLKHGCSRKQEVSDLGCHLINSSSNNTDL